MRNKNNIFKVVTATLCGDTTPGYYYYYYDYDSTAFP